MISKIFVDAGKRPHQERKGWWFMNHESDYTFFDTSIFVLGVKSWNLKIFFVIFITIWFFYEIEK